MFCSSVSWHHQFISFSPVPLSCPLSPVTCCYQTTCLQSPHVVSQSSLYLQSGIVVPTSSLGLPHVSTYIVAGVSACIRNCTSTYYYSPAGFLNFISLFFHQLYCNRKRNMYPNSFSIEMTGSAPSRALPL